MSQRSGSVVRDGVLFDVMRQWLATLLEDRTTVAALHTLVDREMKQKVCMYSLRLHALCSVSSTYLLLSDRSFLRSTFCHNTGSTPRHATPRHATPRHATPRTVLV